MAMMYSHVSGLQRHTCIHRYMHMVYLNEIEFVTAVS